jgi:formamidopyrimidine-DNA glycosylase
MKMPELPEVQTIISDLNKKIKGDTIAGFWSNWAKAIKNMPLKQFEKEIQGRRILEARRKGKNIFVDLSGGKTIYIHLKMTGHLLVKRVTHSVKRKDEKDYFNDRVNQYIHHIFYLGKNKTLEFSDLRKFGKILLVDTDKINELKEIKSLGVDAMDKEFTFRKFQEIIEKYKNKKIRDVLMDQNIISGIGNIYASEILFEAGVLPMRKVSQLKENEIKNIFQSINKVLNKAIRLRGTSDSDYRDTSGAPGGFQKVLKVYQRDGAKCRGCGTMVKRIKMGQRSAFYCPKCQV